MERVWLLKCRREENPLFSSWLSFPISLRHNRNLIQLKDHSGDRHCVCVWASMCMQSWWLYFIEWKIESNCFSQTVCSLLTLLSLFFLTLCSVYFFIFVSSLIQMYYDVLHHVYPSPAVGYVAIHFLFFRAQVLWAMVISWIQGSANAWKQSTRQVWWGCTYYPVKGCLIYLARLYAMGFNGFQWLITVGN